MALERTLSIVKPDGVEKKVIGAIFDRFEKKGLRIIAVKSTRITEAQAKAFYAVHKERPFYKDLVAYMTSGPVVVSVLEGENAVDLYRKIMGATDPAKAEAGTIRKDFGISIERNVVHGSDSLDNAKIETHFFFSASELI